MGRGAFFNTFQHFDSQTKISYNREKDLVKRRTQQGTLPLTFDVHVEDVLWKKLIVKNKKDIAKIVEKKRAEENTMENVKVILRIFRDTFLNG
jgi:hypothetical protein